MKRWAYYVYVIIISCFYSVPAFAQTGVKGGAGIADVAFKRFGQTPYLGFENNALIHEKPLFSAQGGVFFQFQLARSWNLQPELLFATKGINYNKEYLYDDITYKINISYLEIPVLLEYQFRSTKKNQMGLYFGPFGALNMRAKLNREVEGVLRSTTAENVKSFDAGCLLGYSYTTDVNTGNVRFDLRFSYSLINMMDPIEGHIPEYNKTPDEYARNVGVILSVGYQFGNKFKNEER